jgi:hypothetical protein
MSLLPVALFAKRRLQIEAAKGEPTMDKAHHKASFYQHPIAQRAPCPLKPLLLVQPLHALRLYFWCRNWGGGGVGLTASGLTQCTEHVPTVLQHRWQVREDCSALKHRGLAYADFITGDGACWSLE